MTGDEKVRQRDDQGQFAEEASDDEILRAIRDSKFPAVTARWVADTFGIARSPTHQRLTQLHNQGDLERGKLSPRVVIWWLPEEGRDEH